MAKRMCDIRPQCPLVPVKPPHKHQEPAGTSGHLRRPTTLTVAITTALTPGTSGPHYTHHCGHQRPSLRPTLRTPAALIAAITAVLTAGTSGPHCTPHCGHQRPSLRPSLRAPAPLTAVLTAGLTAALTAGTSSPHCGPCSPQQPSLRAHAHRLF